MEVPQILEVRNLSKKLGDDKILDSINFKIESGKITGLVGPNGAGKTTLLNILANRMTYDSGEIYFNHQKSLDLTKLSLAYCPQNDYLDNGLSIRDNLRLYLRFKNYKVVDANARTEELIRQFDMESFCWKQVSKLSLGMKKRVSIVRAISAPADIVLFDEPSAGLDATSRLWLLQILEKLKKEGRCILISSHDLQEVDFLANDLALIDKGHLVANGQASQLLSEFSFRRAIEIREIELLKGLAPDKGTSAYSFEGRTVLLFSNEDVAKSYLEKALFRNYFLRDVSLVDYYYWKTGMVREI